MNEFNISTVGHILKPENQIKNTKTASPHDAHKSFAKFLSDSLQDVNDAQLQSDYMTERLVKGEPVELHDVMISAQKANITLQTTVEIRNKVIEAYQEVMRMQV